MSKNGIIIVLGVLCLLASVWGSVVDHKRVENRERVHAVQARLVQCQESARERLARAEEEKARLKAMIALREEAVVKKNEQIRELQRRITSLRAEIADRDGALKRYEQRLERARNEGRERMREAVSLQTKLSMAQQEQEVLQAELEGLRKHVKEADASGKALERQLAEANARLREAVKQVATLQAANKGLESRLAKAAKAQAGSAGCDKKLAEQKELVSKLSRLHESAVQASMMLEQRNAALEENLVQARKQLAALKSEETAATGANQGTGNKAETARLRMRIAELEKTLAAQRAQGKNHGRSMAPDMGGRVRHLETQLASARAEVQRLRKQAKAAASAGQAAGQAAGQDSGVQASLQRHILEMEKQMQAQAKEMDACRKQNEHARLNNEVLLSTIERLKAENAGLRKNCGAMPPQPASPAGEKPGKTERDGHRSGQDGQG